MAGSAHFLNLRSHKEIMKIRDMTLTPDTPEDTLDEVRDRIDSAMFLLEGVAIHAGELSNNFEMLEIEFPEVVAETSTDPSEFADLSSFAEDRRHWLEALQIDIRVMLKTGHGEVRFDPWWYATEEMLEAA